MFLDELDNTIALLELENERLKSNYAEGIKFWSEAWYEVMGRLCDCEKLTDSLILQLREQGEYRKWLEQQNMGLLDEVVRLRGEVSLLAPSYDLPDLSIEHNVLRLNRENRILKNMILDNGKQEGLLYKGTVVTGDEVEYLRQLNSKLECEVRELRTKVKQED